MNNESITLVRMATNVLDRNNDMWASILHHVCAAESGPLHIGALGTWIVTPWCPATPNGVLGHVFIVAGLVDDYFYVVTIVAWVHECSTHFCGDKDQERC